MIYISSPHYRRLVRVVEQHSISPDGMWIAYDGNVSGNQDLYRMRLPDGVPERLTDDPGNDYQPEWSPAGGEIAFYARRSGTPSLWVMGAAGGNPIEIPRTRGIYLSWSADGLRIVFWGPADVDEVWSVARSEIGGEWEEPRMLIDGANSDWRDAMVFYGRPQASPRRNVFAVDVPGEIRIFDWDGNSSILVEYETAGFANAWHPTFSRDGNTVFFSALGRDGSVDIWSIPAAGGQLRRITESSDPSLIIRSMGISTGPDGKLYLSVSEYESDIYVMDLEY